MQVTIALCSEQGGRDYNEDSVRRFEENGLYAVVIADGLGGHGGGELASSKAADTIIELFKNDPQIDTENIRDFFSRANDEVLKIQTKTEKMKSTGVALFIKNDNVIWGHAGDSRLYHFKEGKLVTQTLDHSVSQMAVYSGEITKEQIRHHEDRNRVLKAFGGNEEISAEISKPLTFSPGFHAFLLCTDGFWEYVFEIEMEVDLAKSKTPDRWIDEMTQRLLKRAPDNNDNYSAAAIFVKRT